MLKAPFGHYTFLHFLVPYFHIYHVAWVDDWIIVHFVVFI